MTIKLKGDKAFEAAPSLKNKALRINLNEHIYGTFAEIGAGQETVRNFFRAGGGSGTIAKAMSAYDKDFSDAIYGIEMETHNIFDRCILSLKYEDDVLCETLLNKVLQDELYNRPLKKFDSAPLTFNSHSYKIGKDIFDVGCDLVELYRSIDINIANQIEINTLIFSIIDPHTNCELLSLIDSFKFNIENHINEDSMQGFSSLFQAQLIDIICKEQ